jgi:hypothetical protein
MQPASLHHLARLSVLVILVLTGAGARLPDADDARPQEGSGVLIDPSCFARSADLLGDVQAKDVRLIRLPEAPSSLRPEFTIASSTVRLVPGRELNSWDVVCAPADGQSATLGGIRLSGLDVVWSWKRVSAGSCSAALSETDRLLRSLIIHASYPGKDQVSISVRQEKESEIPAARSAPAEQLSYDPVLLGRAIRAAESAHSAEATAFSTAAHEQASKAHDSKKDAADSDRKGRSDTRADDGHGRPNNGVSNRDDNFEKRLNGGGRPDGPKYVSGTKWSDVMKAEVAAERKADPASGSKGGRNLYPPSHPLAGKELQGFVKKHRDKITDARIKRLIAKIAEEYERLVQAKRASEPPAPSPDSPGKPASGSAPAPVSDPAPAKPAP